MKNTVSSRVKVAGMSMSRETARKLSKLSEEQLWERIFVLEALARTYRDAQKIFGHEIAHERVVKHWSTMAMQCRSELVHRGLL